MTAFAPLFSACGCWQVGALGALARVGPDCATAARETSEAATEANTKGTLALQYTRDVAEVLQGFQNNNGNGNKSNNLNANTFQSVLKLVQEKKARKALALAREMDDMALNMTQKVNRMTKMLSDAAKEVIPENVRDDMDLEGTDAGATNNNTRGINNGDNSHSRSPDDEEANALMKLLGHADSDVEEVKTNTRSMEQVDIFTAGNTGQNAFSKVAEKENVAVQIFQEIKSVSDAIVDTLATITGAQAQSVSLCAQFMAAATGIEAMFKALRLSKLIQRALETVRRILEAFMGFITTSWDKFQTFFQQFDAGKKLERFTDSLKNSGIGKTIGKVFR